MLEVIEASPRTSGTDHSHYECIACQFPAPTIAAKVNGEGAGIHKNLGDEVLKSPIPELFLGAEEGVCPTSLKNCADAPPRESGPPKWRFGRGPSGAI